MLPVIFSYAQDISTDGMGDEFKEITGFGRRQSGFEGIQTYSTHTVNGSQFFMANWYPGSITTADNQKVGKSYLFLYDKVRQEVFIKPEKIDYVILADKSQVKSFTIIADKPHQFVQAAVYDSTLKGDFFEALVDNNNYSLLKLIQTTYEKANTNDIEKVKQGEFNDSFVDHVTYYLYHNNKLQKIEISNRSIYKVLKDNKSKVDEFYNNHDSEERNEGFLMGLVNSLNS